MANTFTIKVAWNGHTLRDGETVSIQMVPGGSVVDADLTASFSDQVAAAVAGLDGVTWDDGTNTLTIGYGAPNPVPIPITVEADASDELDETFAVTITNQSAGKIGSQSATVIFRDTSGSVPPSVPTDALFTPETGFESGVPENTATNTRVGTLSATSTLPVTWVGTGTLAFRVQGDGVFTDGDLNYEVASAHTITCTPSNAEGAGTALPVTIDIIDVNEAPTDISLSASTVIENSAAGTAVGTCTVTDPDASDTVAWSLTDSSGGVFQINATTGAITTTGVPFSISAGNRTITVKATDGDGLEFTKSFTITVTKTNQAPTSCTFTPAGGSVTIGTAIGTVVGTLSTVDPDPTDTFTYSLVTNPSSRYAISGDKVVTAAALVAGTDTLKARSTDSGGLTVDSANFDIEVTTPAGTATAWPLAGPKDWMFAAFVQPPGNFAAWKSRGCTGMIAVPQDQDYDEWDQAMIAQGLYAIREQHPTAPTADDSVESNKAILIKDEPDNVTNGGNLDYPNVTWTPTQMQAFKTQMLSDNSPTVFPAFSNLVGNHIWPDFGQTSAVMEDYVKGTEIDWLSFDTYQLADGRSNTVTQSTNGVTYHSTYQGHTLDIINGWLDEATETKPVFTFLQTADFANNGLVPTPAQFRVQFWSSIIHGAAGIFYFPILFSPNFSFDGTPATLVAEMKAQHAVAQTYRDILIDTTNGGRTAYTLRKSAPSGSSPTGTQLPYPFEGMSVVDGADTYFFVLNLDDTAGHSLTDATWSLSNVSFGPGEMKAGLVIETPAQTTQFRSSIPVLEPAVPYGRPTDGSRPSLKNPVTQAIPGMRVESGNGSFKVFFDAPGQYWDYDFRGLRCIVNSSGVDVRYCKFDQPAAWSGAAAVIMDWDQASTVVFEADTPTFTNVVFKYNDFENENFVIGTNPNINIVLWFNFHRTEADISRNKFNKFLSQGINMGAGRIDQNVFTLVGFDDNGHNENFSITFTHTGPGTRLEITRNYADHWNVNMRPGVSVGGPTGNIKCWNEGAGRIKGELVIDDNYFFSSHPSNVDPVPGVGGQNPWYVIQNGEADARRWFGNNKVSGYLHDNNPGGAMPYPYTSSGASVQANFSFQNITDPVKSHTFADVNCPTKPGTTTVTWTPGTGSMTPSFTLGSNTTAVEIRYAKASDEQWSRLTEITSGTALTGLADGEYTVEHRGINRGTTSISRGDWVSNTVTIGTVTPSAPAFTGAGAVLTQTTGTNGSPVVGDSFSVSYTASGFPTPTPSYQWKWEDGTAISGATSSTYTSVGTDEDHQLKCSVHLSSTEGTADDDTGLSGVIASAGGGGGGIAIDTANLGTQNGVYVHFGWSGDFTIPIPAARTSGTLMIAVLDFGEYSDAGAPTLSAGWTKSSFFKTFRGGLAIAWKVSDGTETSLSVNIDETQYGTDQCTIFGKVFLITGQTITPSGISGYGDWSVTDSFCTGVSTTISSGVTNAIAFQIVQFDNANTTTGTVAGWTKLYETNGVNGGGGSGTLDYERRSGHAVYYKTGQSTGTVSGTQVNLDHALAVYRNGLGFYVY